MCQESGVRDPTLKAELWARRIGAGGFVAAIPDPGFRRLEDARCVVDLTKTKLMGMISPTITDKLKNSLLWAGWRLPFLRTVASRRPVVLIYHGIPAKGSDGAVNARIFEQHVEFLKAHFEVVTPGSLARKRRGTDRIRVLLTFDDGFCNNAEVVAPILRRHQVPASFFICSRHSTPGKYLWFSYLWALEEHFPEDRFCFRGECFDMSLGCRAQTIRRLRETLLSLTPHPVAMDNAIDEELPRLEDFIDRQQLTDRYAGMTEDQVRNLAADSLFSVGAHTMDHPFLTMCEPEEVFRQISENKAWIEGLTNRRCDTIAYPIGEYDDRVLNQCREIGFAYGYAQTPKLGVHYNLELPRLGIYSTALDVLGFKVQWGNVMRQLQIETG
jgi:peptidoglycan/xylan/chitin deacetylase (PgdA/CDA1 family)